jgi:hypothetical protein
MLRESIAVTGPRGLAPLMRDASICLWDLITPGGYYRAVAVCAGGWAMWSGFSELRFVTGLGWGADLRG